MVLKIISMFFATILFAATPTQVSATKRKHSKRKKVKRYSKKEYKNVYGGIHWRIKTPRGAVHVWVPKGYVRRTAGTVVFIHGYGNTADSAWKTMNLAYQFKKSRQNAIFIVPGAPSGRNDKVKWNSLRHLKRSVMKANIRLPNGPTVVIGHSGAFRTIRKWVNARFLSQIILLDAMYGGQNQFDKFIAKGKYAKNHKLVIIASDTAKASKTFAKKHPHAAIRKSIPLKYSKFTKRQKRSSLLYMHSQYNHGAIVRNGKVIPLLLRLTPLKLL